MTDVSNRVNFILEHAGERGLSKRPYIHSALIVKVLGTGEKAGLAWTEKG